MPAIITNKFRLNNAEQFSESFSETNNQVYYLGIGRPQPFATNTRGDGRTDYEGTDSAPNTPSDSVSREFYTFDDLAKLAQEGVKNRESEIIKATKIIEEKVQIYREKIEQKTIIPTINLLRNHFERIRKEELLKAEKEINKGASIDEVMDKLSKTLSKKYLHHPTKVFNEFSNQKLEKALAILKKIYKIED